MRFVTFNNSSLPALMYKIPLFPSTFQIIDPFAKDLYYSHAQEIEGDLKKCSDQFKMFERQDLKYQEDLKHLKQKLKKVEEKILKVIFLLSSNMSTLQLSPQSLHPIGSLEPSYNACHMWRPWQCVGTLRAHCAQNIMQNLIGVIVYWEDIELSNSGARYEHHKKPTLEAHCIQWAGQSCSFGWLNSPEYSTNHFTNII